MPSLNYRQLTAILEDLRFNRRVIRGSHVLFTHDATETVVLLPIVRGTEKVRAAIIVSTRFILDAKGIANGRRWEELVNKHRVREQIRDILKREINNCRISVSGRGQLEGLIKEDTRDTDYLLLLSNIVNRNRKPPERVRIADITKVEEL